MYVNNLHIFPSKRHFYLMELNFFIVFTFIFQQNTNNSNSDKMLLKQALASLIMSYDIPSIKQVKVTFSVLSYLGLMSLKLIKNKHS